ncbi:MAG: saccharopine dehydrogenase NADP-binding domain-containing protein [Candidatus Rokuibacteriota bacterium]
MALSRRTGVDAEDGASLRAALRPGDVVVDAVGPFQDRSLALLETAMDLGCDVIDISDSLAFAGRVLSQRARIERAGIRVLTGCSSVSAITAAFVGLSGVREPARVRSILVPATRDTAHSGATGSLLRSVGRPVRVLREGRLVTRVGWTEAGRFALPAPIGRVRAFLFESADSVLLPLIWPRLQYADFFVTTHVPGLDSVLALAARSAAVHALVRLGHRHGLGLARRLGSRVGGLMVEVAGSDGAGARLALVAADRGHFTPIVPAVLAARAIVEGRFVPKGLVPAHRHVEPTALLDYLSRLGVHFSAS